MTKMRSSSKKLLLWLYSPTADFRRVSYRHLKYLLPNISCEGKRSLVYHLKNKKFLTAEKYGSQKFLTLTAFGQDFIESNFLFLNKERRKWTGEWIMLLIAGLNKKKFDFRHLRSFLNNNGCISFERGVYLYPGFFNHSLKNYIQSNFADSVVVVALEDWLYGDHRMIFMERFNLMELANQYSSISNEINRVLKKNNNKKILNDREYKEIFSIYNRLFPLFVEDLGFLNYYLSNSIDGKKILKDVQNLVF